MELVSEYYELIHQEEFGLVDVVIILSEFVEDALVAVRACQFTLDGYSLCKSLLIQTQWRKNTMLSFGFTSTAAVGVEL